MTHPLDGAFAKIGRAEEHARCLEQDIARWRREVRQTFTGKKNADGTVVKVHIEWDPPPPRDDWALTIGDCLHNLRSALDHTVYALSSPKPKGCEFPISLNRKSFYSPQSDRRGGLYKLGGINHGLVWAVIEAAQPWRRKQRPSDDPLWLVHDLNRKDKHRLLTPVGLFPTDLNAALVIRWVVPPTGGHVRGRVPIPLKNNALFCTIYSHTPIRDVVVNLNVAAEIRLRRRDRSWGVTAALREACDHTRGLVEEIRDALV